MRVGLGHETDLAADIVFRYLERLGQALAGRLEWFQAGTERDGAAGPDGAGGPGRAAGRPASVAESVAAPTGLARR